MDESIMMQSHYYGFFEPARTIQIPGAPHQHEVRVWLPPTYHITDRSYPTLWVTDNFLEIAWSAITCSMMHVAPELILVSIGAPRDSVSYGDFIARRSWDFNADQASRPEDSILNRLPAGGADVFRDYLIDVLRPQLAQEYRMKADDHGIFGHSNGGAFVSYCLFSRPEGFAKYLGSSGFELDYAGMFVKNMAGLSDLKAKAYFAVGDAEGLPLEPGMNRMVEVLEKAGFPSFEMTHKVLQGGLDHFTIIPVMMMEGVRYLWSEGLVGPEWMMKMAAVMSPADETV